MDIEMHLPSSLNESNLKLIHSLRTGYYVIRTTNIYGNKSSAELTLDDVQLLIAGLLDLIQPDVDQNPDPDR